MTLHLLGPRWFHRLVLRVAALSALSALGCAAEQHLEPEDEPLAQQWVAPTLVDAGQPLLFPVELAAAGAGCPPGTWSAEFDGEVVRITFDRYEATLQEGIRAVSRECAFRVRVPKSAGRHYAVRNASFRGYAQLGPGTNAWMSLRQYFSGVPSDPRGEPRVDVSGPADRTFSFREDTRDEDVIWHFCGYQGYFNVVTGLHVRRQDAGSGFITLSAPGEKRGEVTFRIVTRQCPGLLRDAGPPVRPRGPLGADAGGLDAGAPDASSPRSLEAAFVLGRAGRSSSTPFAGIASRQLGKAATKEAPS